MDITPSIWLSSVTSAVLFFSGGRLWGKAQRALDPLLGGDRVAREAAAAEIRRLSTLVAEKERESVALRGQIEDLREALTVTQVDVEVEVEAQSAAPPPDRPYPGQMLDEAIEARLGQLCSLEPARRAAVVSDLRGLLVASSGEGARGDALAGAASMASDTAARMRQLLPFGEPLEVRISFAGDTTFTARWIRGDHEGLLLATVDAERAEPDFRADAICAAISNLIRGS